MIHTTFHHLPPEKKQRILDCAINEFTAYTYEKTSINRILEEAKIPKGSFYQYFDNKEDLYILCIKTVYKQAVDLQIEMGVGILEGGYEQFGKNLAHFQQFYLSYQEELKKKIGDKEYQMLYQIQDLPPSLRNATLLEIATDITMPQIKKELLSKYRLDEEMADFYAYLLSVSEQLIYDYGTRETLSLERMNYLNYRYMDAIIQDVKKEEGKKE